MNLLVARVSIEGTRPFLFHVFGPDAIPLQKGEKTGVAGNDPDEWRKTVTYIPSTRQLYIAPSYIFASLRDGSAYTKKGQSSVQKYLVGTLQVLDDRVLFENRILPEEGEPDPHTTLTLPTDDTLPVYIDFRAVKNPVTKGRNVRYRVCAATGWRLSFTLLWDKTVVGREMLRAIIHDAGTLCGLGDGRRVGMGRYTCTSYEVEDFDSLKTLEIPSRRAAQLIDFAEV